MIPHPLFRTIDDSWAQGLEQKSLRAIVPAGDPWTPSVRALAAHDVILSPDSSADVRPARGPEDPDDDGRPSPYRPLSLGTSSTPRSRVAAARRHVPSWGLAPPLSASDSASQGLSPESDSAASRPPPALPEALRYDAAAQTGPRARGDGVVRAAALEASMAAQAGDGSGTPSSVPTEHSDLQSDWYTERAALRARHQDGTATPGEGGAATPAQSTSGGARGGAERGGKGHGSESTGGAASGTSGASAEDLAREAVERAFREAGLSRIEAEASGGTGASSSGWELPQLAVRATQTLGGGPRRDGARQGAGEGSGGRAGGGRAVQDGDDDGETPAAGTARPGGSGAALRGVAEEKRSISAPRALGGPPRGLPPRPGSVRRLGDSDGEGGRVDGRAGTRRGRRPLSAFTRYLDASRGAAREGKGEEGCGTGQGEGDRQGGTDGRFGIAVVPWAPLARGENAGDRGNDGRRFEAHRRAAPQRGERDDGGGALSVAGRAAIADAEEDGARASFEVVHAILDAIGLPGRESDPAIRRVAPPGAEAGGEAPGGAAAFGPDARPARETWADVSASYEALPGFRGGYTVGAGPYRAGPPPAAMTVREAFRVLGMVGDRRSGLREVLEAHVSVLSSRRSAGSGGGRSGAASGLGTGVASSIGGDGSRGKGASSETDRSGSALVVSSESASGAERAGQAGAMSGLDASCSMAISEQPSLAEKIRAIGVVLGARKALAMRAIEGCHRRMRQVRRTC